MTAIVQDRCAAAPEGVLRTAEIDRPTMRDDEVRVQAAGVDRGTRQPGVSVPFRSAQDPDPGSIP